MLQVNSPPNRLGRVTLVELNEFNPEFLAQAAVKLGLSNIDTVLKWSHTTTTTDDQVEHQGLDPWVQWVNVHSGKPSSDHKVKRLGDTRSQAYPPFWTRLAERGWTWGAWGVMNTPRVTTDRCEFFFPDPWSFEEQAYPADLEQVLRLPRYVSKNYLDLDKKKAAVEALAMAGALARPNNWSASFDFSTRFISESLRHRPNIHTLTSFVDYLGFCIFADRCKKQNPDFRVIFLNLIAHLQHQFWQGGDKIHPEMELGLRLADKILGRLIDDADPDDVIIVMNGMRQRNVAGEGFHVYRQNNPAKVLEWLGVMYASVEQCMTHDAHALFSSQKDADEAARLLEACKLDDGTSAFFVEKIADDQVFYQIAFEHKVAEETNIICGNRSTRLSDLVSLYAVRTGAHVTEGDIFSRNISLPASMHNHEVSSYIESYFEGKS